MFDNQSKGTQTPVERKESQIEGAKKGRDQL